MPSENEKSYTPGKWGIAQNHMFSDGNDRYQYSILANMQRTVCDVMRQNWKEYGRNKFKRANRLNPDDEAKANAILIAAAPEMLKALEFIYKAEVRRGRSKSSIALAAQETIELATKTKI